MHGEKLLIVMRMPFLCGFLLLFSASPARSQETNPAVASDTSQTSQDASAGTVLKRVTRAVVLDVVVTDKAGRPVSGLGTADFTLLEDGQLQAIASFEASASAHPVPNAHEARASKESSPVPRPEIAQVILLLDEMNTGFKDLAYARYSMGKLLRKNGGQLQQSTALMALTDQGLKLLHDSTRDGNALWNSLDHHSPQLPWRLNGSVYGASERLGISLGALAEIASAGEGSTVRRNIIWISPGFPILSGLDITPESRDKAFAAIRNLSDKLLRARVTVYTVDPRGVPEASSLSTLSSASPSTFNATYFQIFSQTNNPAFGDLALQHFARETGGKSFWGHNNIDAEVASSISAGTNYYALSYYPSNSLFDGNFRKIAVTLRRPGLAARTRDGYFAMPEPPPPTEDELTDQIEVALSNPLSYVGIPVSATASVLPSSTGSVRIVLTVDRRALTWSTSINGDQQCPLIAVAAAFSSASHEKPVRIQKEDFAYVLPAAKVSSLSEKPVVYTLDFPLDSSVSRIRILLRDKTSGRTGSVDLPAPYSPSPDSHWQVVQPN